MLPNQTVLSAPRAAQSLCRLATIAALAMGVSIASHAAGGGEALDIELPSMRTPIEVQQFAGPSVEAAVHAGHAAHLAQHTEPLTRARVRESLAMARLANLVNPGGEMGDTPEVLQAREDFNALQTEVMEGEYRIAALRLQQAQTADLLAQAQGYAAVDSATASQPSVEVVVVPSNKAYQMLFESGPGAETMDDEVPAATGVILLLVNEGAYY